eukprot:TRINITY_DN6545_c0_g1_i1.p1 TRINITY_DN6545_c0_g1~~TRINITY_DN6545_c0_g1_i1.p1  ORF type:complete len:687 (-),score=217.80 TRINITY_DN6545_c0_g1_i1:327-2387(-)
MDGRIGREVDECLVLSGAEDEDDGMESAGLPPPGSQSSHPIESTLLAPFLEGWRREVVLRSGSESCDVYYIPPASAGVRLSRESVRKKRSKRELARHFDDFPSQTLDVINFSYVNRPLGLNNEAYEIVRRPYDGLRPKGAGSNYSEDTHGLSGSDSGDSEEDDILEEFAMDMPLVLQSLHDLVGMKAQHKKRRLNRRHDRPNTPFLAEEATWTDLDDDPMGVFTALGGASSPPTPPPLRALKLTPSQTAEKIRAALLEVKREAGELSLEKEEPLKENMASHDVAIRKFKNHPVERKSYSGFNEVPRVRRPEGSKNSLPCTLHCAGSNGLLPNLTCCLCQGLFHARCQGVFASNICSNNYKCRACLGTLQPRPSPQQASTLQVKLPMPPANGKRPIVELVIHQAGRYQAIKFSNNMQVTETISRSLFDRATSLQRTLYQKATKVPRVGGRPLFLAINPTTLNNRAQLTALLSQASKATPPSRQQQQPSSNKATPPAKPGTDQVSILVRSQSSSKPVLLNVPRKIALKVKPGTTLSFSASSNQKYTVIDNKIHPPVNSSSSNPTPAPKPKPPDLSVYKGITISRVPEKRTNTVSRATPPAPIRRPPPSSPAPLPSFKGSSDLDMSPCTPYCPGVTGFPEVECKGCQSLFHAQCVGLQYRRNMSNFLCKMCSRNVIPKARNAPQVIDLD